MNTKLGADSLLEGVIKIARSAGDSIMQIYQGKLDVVHKDDGSPVTLADEVANAYILQELPKLLSDILIVSEESLDSQADFQGSTCFWLVDPLDGTKEFISKNGQFTVNIALIERGVPTLGVVYAPALDCLYAGYGALAFTEKSGIRAVISCRSIPEAGLTVVGSRSHGDDYALNAFLDSKVVNEIIPVGSSLKLCLVAAGQADLYPRLGRTMEWDIAAGHAVLLAAGGTVCDLVGNPLKYGKPGFGNPHFVARAKTEESI
jgi:3'(2'), 5'-bisphosphate nucleotidase